MIPLPKPMSLSENPFIQVTRVMPSEEGNNERSLVKIIYFNRVFIIRRIYK